jgi:hypothetical protein
VYQIAATSPAVFHISKPSPDRAGSHHNPCANGDRSATETAKAGAATRIAKTISPMRFTDIGDSRGQTVAMRVEDYRIRTMFAAPCRSPATICRDVTIAAAAALR